jgi:hypothetical protein
LCEEPLFSRPQIIPRPFSHACLNLDANHPLSFCNA